MLLTRTGIRGPKPRFAGLLLLRRSTGVCIRRQQQEAKLSIDARTVGLSIRTKATQTTGCRRRPRTKKKIRAMCRLSCGTLSDQPQPPQLLQ
jgi:hypothetical protein